MDRQYSRIANKTYQSYLNNDIDNYGEIVNRLNSAYDKYTGNISKRFGVASRYKLEPEQYEERLSYSVRAGVNR